MPQSLCEILIHFVFSTRQRYPFLQDGEVRLETQAYLAGIFKQWDCSPLIVNGTSDHMHALVYSLLLSRELASRRSKGFASRFLKFSMRIPRRYQGPWCGDSMFHSFPVALAGIQEEWNHSRVPVQHPCLSSFFCLSVLNAPNPDCGSDSRIGLWGSSARSNPAPYTRDIFN